MGLHKCQLQFERRLHVGCTFTSLLLTTSDIINFDSLRQPKTTHFEFHLVQGKRSFVSYEWVKFSPTGQTKNWMQKRSCLFAKKTWMKMLFQWWPTGTFHNINLYSWSSAKLHSRSLSYYSSKGRVGEKSGNDVGSSGFFAKTFPTKRSVVYPQKWTRNTLKL